MNLTTPHVYGLILLGALVFLLLIGHGFRGIRASVEV